MCVGARARVCVCVCVCVCVGGWGLGGGSAALFRVAAARGNHLVVNKRSYGEWIRWVVEKRGAPPVLNENVVWVKLVRRGETISLFRTGLSFSILVY